MARTTRPTRHLTGPSAMPLPDRMALAGSDCTLDGAPAIVTDPRAPFGAIVDFRTGRAVRYGWHTIARVLAQGGAFTPGDATHWPVDTRAAGADPGRVPPGYPRLLTDAR